MSVSSAEQRFNWHLQSRYADAVLSLSASGNYSMHYYLLAISLNLSAIQIFMWLYMASFYLEAPPAARKRRLIDILISLIILILSTTSAIVNGLYIYKSLFDVTPGSENLSEAFAIESAYFARYLSPGGLVGEIGFRIADGVMVGTILLNICLL